MPNARTSEHLLMFGMLCIVGICAIVIITFPLFRNLSGKGSLGLQSPTTAQLGEQIRVDVTVTNITNLAGVELDVAYDPAVLRYTGAQQGTFLSANGVQTMLLNTSVASSGYVDNLVIVRLQGGASGNGVLLSLFFTSIGQGSADISLRNVLFSNPLGQPITADLVGTRITINPRDSDGDGVPDGQDECPGTPLGTIVNSFGCPVQTDADSDGVVDSLDQCPGTPSGVTVDSNGCPIPKDSDGDGVTDIYDVCPGTPAGVKVTSNGCPVDSDRDGVADYIDLCPGTSRGTIVDARGCPLDSDKDGVYDNKDRCPGTPVGTNVDKNGCPRRR